MSDAQGEMMTRGEQGNMSENDVVFHVEIEEFGGVMEAFIVQNSPDPNGAELIQLTFNAMPRFLFQLHWRNGTSIGELNVRKTDPAFHRAVELAIYQALGVFIANDFIAL